MDELCTFLGNCRCPNCLAEMPQLMEDDPDRYQRLRAMRVSFQEEMRKRQLKTEKLENAKAAAKEEEEQQLLEEELRLQAEEERQSKLDEALMMEQERVVKQKEEQVRLAAKLLKERLLNEIRIKEEAMRRAIEIEEEQKRLEEERKQAELRHKLEAERMQAEAEQNAMDEEMDLVKHAILKREHEEEERKAKEIELRKLQLDQARKAKEAARLHREETARKKAEALLAQEAMIKAMEAEQKRLKEEQARRERDAQDSHERAMATAKAAAKKQAATFVLPRHMGFFEFNKAGRKFRGVRKLKQLAKQEDGSLARRDIALVTCSDIMFLCSPSNNGPFVLIHMPSPRGNITAETETNPSFPPFTLKINFSGENYWLQTSSQNEIDFWLKTIRTPEPASGQ